MSKFIRVGRGLCVALIIVTYALLVHHVNTSGQASTLGAVLALMPVFLMAITYAWHTTSRMKAFGLLLATTFFCWFSWSFVRQHTDIMFWMQDIGLMMILLLTFARTLQKDRKPLCVHFAEMINGDETLPLAHIHYARQVTVAWVYFFAMIIVISTVLFFLAPLTIWSIFVNFFTLPLVALMFVVEFMVRRRVLTDLPTGNMLDAVRAYLNNSARTR